MLKKDIDFSPTDRAALNQARELNRLTRVIRKAFVRLAATALVSTPKRYIQLVDEVRKIITTEHRRIYELDHPKKKRG